MSEDGIYSRIEKQSFVPTIGCPVCGIVGQLNHWLDVTGIDVEPRSEFIPILRCINVGNCDKADAISPTARLYSEQAS